MRLKVGNTRIAVSKQGNDEGKERGIMYLSEKSTESSNMSWKESDYTIEQIRARVENANKRYNVFFNANDIVKLRNHFTELVKNSRGKEVSEFRRILVEYKGYTYIDKKSGKEKLDKLEYFKYSVAGKNITLLLKNYVYEYMDVSWYDEEALRGATEILKCMCDGKKYNASIQMFLSRSDAEKLVKAFLNASSNCKYRPFVKKTSELEGVFNSLIMYIVGKCNGDAYWDRKESEIEESITNQISLIKKLSYLNVKRYKAIEKVYINGKDVFTYRYAENERMQAMLVRMRKKLKRDSNGEVAIKLLKGLASGELTKTVGELEKDHLKELRRFIDSINKDYYKFDIVKSVKNMDVKAQVRGDVLNLSGIIKDESLTKTLESYSASQESADEMLAEIKRMLFMYFLPNVMLEEERLFEAPKLWKFPTIEEIYFDEEFQCDFEEHREESSPFNSIRNIWAGKYDKGTGKIYVDQKLLKKRINYVNVGRYKELSKDCSGKTETYGFKLYWISYIKDFVEKNYVSKKRKLIREECWASDMLLRCWKNIIRFICGKYMDIGKMVYHIAMPENMNENNASKVISYGELQSDYKTGISSFTYEMISAEDNLQRSIANTTVAAANNFTRAAFTDDADDGLYLPESRDKKDEKKKIFEEYIKDDAVKQILRFYGGVSSFEGMALPMGQTTEESKPEIKKFIKELVELLKVIRNENYHYAPGYEENIDIKYTKILIAHDIELYKQLVKKRYYNNNVVCFYKKEDIQQLVNKLYSHVEVGQAQIPAFYSMWKRKDLPDDIASLGMKLSLDTDDMKKLLGAFYFICKEIYYREFILDREQCALKGFYNAMGISKSNYKDKFAEDNFKSYVEEHKEEYNSFGVLCQGIMNQYGSQNSNRDEEKYKHFRMLLHKYTKTAFIEFLKEKYDWLFEFNVYEVCGDNSYLEDKEIAIVIPVEDLVIGGTVLRETYRMAWYTFGHYIHPRQLNLLIGEFKNYIQYIQDIERRARYAGQNMSKYEVSKVQRGISKASEIIEILDFVRVVTGRVTGAVKDYYEDNDQYARYLSNYIAFAENDEPTFEKLKKFCGVAENGEATIDIYVDNANPKILHNIEFARMYAGGDVPLINKVDKKDSYKISKKEIEECLENGNKVTAILNNGLCKNEEEQEFVANYQRTKGRITLNDVTNVYDIVSELLGKLIALSYLRERDQMYLLLGFYYMLLRGEKKWMQVGGKKETKVIEQEYDFDKGKVNDKFSINGGLVLYQIIGVFDYGTKLVYWSKSKNGLVLKEMEDYLQISQKIPVFYNNHKTSYTYAMKLFQDDTYETEIINIRNYIDHSKYYTDLDKSILNLYCEIYTKYFGYSIRLRQSVLNNFQNILDSYFIKAELEFIKTEEKEIKLALKKELSSRKFNYKLEGGKSKEIDAKSEQFLKMLKKVLEYKR